MARKADLRIVLDGSHGLTSNVSQHSGGRGDFVVFRDVITDVADRIVKRDGKGTTLGSVAGSEIQVIHEYIFTNPVDGTTYTHVLGAINAGNYIYDSINSGASWTGQTLPIAPTQGGRWFFCNAGVNSVLAVNGRDAALIGSQAFTRVQLTSVMTVAAATTVDITGAPIPHPFVNGETLVINGASPAAYNGSYVITVLTATTFQYTFAGGSSPATGDIGATANRVVWRKAGQAAPSVAPTYSLATADPPYNTGTVSMTQGSPAVAGIGTTFTAGMAGKDMSINGVDYTILAFVNATSLTLTENFKEATATYAYNIFRGVGDWITGPRYVYAFRNPSTGHLSNVSPVLEITEQNQFGRTITITIAGSAENTAAFNNGYTQIQLFRTALNAYTLVALNEFLANNNAGSAIVYTETVAKFSDAYLTDLLAPFDQNGVPPIGLSCLVSHLDRLWGIGFDGRLRFTPAPFELSYGVAIEAWPTVPQFARVVPAPPSGLLIVGGASVSEAIVIQTAKGDYSIDGFDPLTFSLFRLKTRHSGGFLYSASTVDGALIEFYRDKRLLYLPTRYNTLQAPESDDVGRVIQDKLSLVSDALLSKVRLHWFAAKNRNFLLLSVPSSNASTANDYTFVWDLDKGFIAYEWNAGFSAFATVHDATTGEVQLWAGDSTGAVYRLLGGGAQDAGANFQPVIKTTILRPLAVESWSNLSYVELYVKDVTNPWTGRVYIHEQSWTGATDGTVTPFTFRVAPPKSQSAQGKKLIWTASESIRTRSEAIQLEVTFPLENAPNWIEQIVIGFRNAEERVG